MSAETREKLSKANKGQTRSKQWCKHNAEIKKGTGNGMYGQGYKVSGEKNGMYGKSAVKGRKWMFNINENKSYLLAHDEYTLLLKLPEWRFGRI